MFALLRFFLALFSSLFKSKSRLEAENAALRRQLIVLQRKVRGRVYFTLGFEVAQSSIAKYMVKRHGPPSCAGHRGHGFVRCCGVVHCRD
jgi:hypothetical protein